MRTAPHRDDNQDRNHGDDGRAHIVNAAAQPRVQVAGCGTGELPQVVAG